jgi:hypothetical protein
VFIQIIQGRCAREQEMRDAVESWRRDLAPSAEGWLGSTYGFTDDHTFVGVVRFESAEKARRNSDRPEQTAWWQSTEQLFDGPVEFHDSADVVSMLAGGSDDAGFVQVIRGKADDPARLRSVVDSVASVLHEARPEIIGATMAIEEDGTVTETVAFTDEASAREGERKPMPESLREADMGMRDLSYLDLHRPWFASP